MPGQREDLIPQGGCSQASEFLDLAPTMVALFGKVEGREPHRGKEEFGVWERLPF